MGAKAHPCGCTFDPELVDSNHNAGEAHPHALLGKKAEEAPEMPKETIAEKVDKMLHRSHHKKTDE
jgi:hypothetical protein